MLSTDSFRVKGYKSGRDEQRICSKLNRVKNNGADSCHGIYFRFNLFTAELFVFSAYYTLIVMPIVKWPF